MNSIILELFITKVRTIDYPDAHIINQIVLFALARFGLATTPKQILLPTTADNTLNTIILNVS